MENVKGDNAMPTYEGLRLKLLKYPRTGKIFTERRKKLLNKKCERRCNCVKLDKLVIKFNVQNGCKKDDLKAF